MIIFVKAKPKAREERIEKIDEKHFVVYIKEAPERGKANEAIIRKLAGYFQIPVSQIIFKSGGFSRNKMFEIKL